METLRAITIISIVAAMVGAALCLVGVTMYVLVHHKNMKRLIKTFRVVNFISRIITVVAAALGVIGIAITGIYPGIIMPFLLVGITMASHFYVKKLVDKSVRFQRNCYIILTIINLFVILVVFWSSFVTIHDRVFHDCC